MKIPWKIIPSLIGTICVTLNIALWANIFYTIGSTILMIDNYKVHNKPYTILFGVYTILAILGIIYYLYKCWIKV